jgi:hypothetical protein
LYKQVGGGAACDVRSYETGGGGRVDARVSGDGWTALS